MNKKKLVSLCLVLALLVTAAVGATFAYFTDEDSEENVFTVGSVDIEIVESTLHRHNDNATDQEILDDSEEYQAYLDREGENLVPGKWVKKAPYIRNVGKNDAYVRVIVEQSQWFWDNGGIMEYTTAQLEGKIVDSDPIFENGKVYLTYTFVEPLKAGELSYYAPIWQFKIHDKVDVNVEGQQENIKIYAEAIQAEGFADYEAAFAAFDAQKTTP